MRLLGSLILVGALIGLCGELMAPLLLVLAADVAVVRLLLVELAASRGAAVRYRPS